MHEAQSAQWDLDVADRAAVSVKLNRVDLIAVKKAVGPNMRAAIISLKQQFIRIGAFPDARSKLTVEIAQLDQMLAAWETPDDGSADTTIAALFPRSNIRATGPRAGWCSVTTHRDFLRVERRPDFRRAGWRRVSDPAHAPRLRDVRGPLRPHAQPARRSCCDGGSDGLPTNSDPARGVTKREVEVAIDNRLKALAPESSQSMSTGSGDRRSMCIAPVDDVQRLSESIDFGKVSRSGSRIEVAVNKEYIASVPRLPAELPVAARPSNPRDDEPKVPANADTVTKSLARLQSSDIFRKKDALNQLSRIRPNDRLKEVHGAVLPLLENDDEDVIKHAVRVLAVWQSPEAMAKLIDLVSDSRVFLRWDVIKSLGKYDDAKAAEALIDRLKEDGHIVEGELRSMGSVAEQPLIALLRNPDDDLRRKACNILKFVGGSATLKAMSKIPPDPDIGVRMAAQEAYQDDQAARQDGGRFRCASKKKSDPSPAGKARTKS